MPDFERRSRASFISSKEGGTPASFSRSLMKRRSSYCLRVSISTSPQVRGVVQFRDIKVRKLEKSEESENSDIGSCRFLFLQTLLLETNHEQTLYVPYVFRNYLISRQ